MKIINPIYDYAFKYLMDNNDVAKQVLEIILNQKIVSLEMQNVETPIMVEGKLTISRYDFKAIISDANGKYTKVLIELQKYKHISPIERFRQYLGDNYAKLDSFINSKGINTTEALPIISIYILGFDLKEIPTRFLIIDNKCIDGVTEEEYRQEIESEFIKKLTHKTYILLVGDKPNYNWKGRRIEAFMRLFRQKLRNEEKNEIIEIEEELKEEEILQPIIERLNEATIDEKLKRQLQIEKDYEAGVREAELLKEEALKLAEQERQRAEQKEKELEQVKTKSVLKFFDKGLTIDEIAETLGLNVDEVTNILRNNARI